MPNNKRARWDKSRVEKLIARNGSEKIELNLRDDGEIISVSYVQPSPMKIARMKNASSITEYLGRSDFPYCAEGKVVMINGTIGTLVLLDFDEDLPQSINLTQRNKLRALIFAVYDENEELHPYSTKKLRDQFGIKHEVTEPNLTVTKGDNSKDNTK